jgi:anti-anti-sigma factor
MSLKRIEYGGSLDIASVPSFVATVETAAEQQERLVLDMGDLEFLDSTGVRSLITLKQDLLGKGCTLSIVGLRQDILDILDILGIRELILD